MRLHSWTWGFGGADETTSIWIIYVRCSIIWCLAGPYEKGWKVFETTSYSWLLAGDVSTINRYFASEISRNGFFGKEWKCHLTLTFFCCDIPNGKISLAWNMVQQHVHAFLVSQLPVKLLISCWISDEQLVMGMFFCGHLKAKTTFTQAFWIKVRGAKLMQSWRGSNLT